ncbi:MAG: sugar ABC transporter permease [Aggregatilineales bacterium]
MSAITNRVLPKTNRKSEFMKSGRRGNRYLYAFIFMFPGMALFFAFLLIPLSNSFYYSRFDWNGFGPPTDVIGFGNYTRLFEHAVFQTALHNSAIIVILSVAVQLPLALMLALVVGRGRLPGRSIFRAILFIPFVFSEILTAYIWIYVFHPQDGLANLMLRGIIPEFQNVLWLADRNIVIYAIFMVITWKYFGLHMILYMAALQGVSSEVEDAARIDGASETQVIQKITIPLIGPTIRLTVYLSVLGSFQQFVLVWILTTGGPANASQVIATYLYKFGILGSKLGYGSAVAVVLFLITLTFSIFYQYFFMRKDYSTE